jgi:hypothetical protein
MSITPKLHVLEDHFLPQLYPFKGLADYGEDFVEKAHQTGIREEAQTLAIRDCSRVAQLYCRMEHRRSLPGVKEKQRTVLENSSHKRMSLGMNQLLTAKSKQKLESKEKRTIAIDKVGNQDERLKNGRRRNYNDLKNAT